MKIKVLVLSLLISSVCFGQTNTFNVSGATATNKGIFPGSMTAQKGLIPGTLDTLAFPYLNPGAMTRRPQDSIIYIYNGTKWVRDVRVQDSVTLFATPTSVADFVNAKNYLTQAVADGRYVLSVGDTKIANVKTFLYLHPGYTFSRAMDSLMYGSVAYTTILIPDSTWSLSYPIYFYVPTPRSLTIVNEAGSYLRLQNNATRSPYMPVSEQSSGVAAWTAYSSTGGWNDSSLAQIRFMNYGILDCNQTNNRQFQDTTTPNPGRDVHGIQIKNIPHAEVRGGIVKDCWWGVSFLNSSFWYAHDLVCVQETKDTLDNQVSGTGLTVGQGSHFGNGTNIYTNGYSECIDLNPMAWGNVFNNVIGENIYEGVMEFSGSFGTVVNGIWGRNCHNVLKVRSYTTLNGNYAPMLNILNGTGMGATGTIVNGAYALYDSTLNLREYSATSPIIPFFFDDPCTVNTMAVWYYNYSPLAPTQKVKQVLSTNGLTEINALEVYTNTGVTFDSASIIDIYGGIINMKKFYGDIAANQSLFRVYSPMVASINEVNGRTMASGSAVVTWSVISNVASPANISISRIDSFANNNFLNGAPGFSTNFRIFTYYPYSYDGWHPFDSAANNGCVWLSHLLTDITLNTNGYSLQWINSGGKTSGSKKIPFTIGQVDPTYAPVAVSPAGGLNFNATYIQDSSSRLNGVNFTIGFRMKLNSLPVTQARILNFGGVSNYRIIISTAGLMSLVYKDVSSVTQTFNGPTLVANTFYSIIVQSSSDGAVMKFWVNSAASPTQTYSGPAMNNIGWGTFRLGSAAAGANPCDWVLQEFLYYQTVATQPLLTNMMYLLTNGVGSGTPLPSANTFVGNGNDLAAAVPITGDIALSNTGATTINPSSVTEAKMLLADNTTWNFGTVHGFVPKAPTVTTNKFLAADGTWAVPTAGTGTGTVTSVSSGNITGFATVGVATATTTPAFTFSLTNAGSHKFWGNNTGGLTPPAYVALVVNDLPTAIPNANLANMPAFTIKANNLGTNALPTDVTLEALGAPKVVATGLLTGQTTAVNVVTYTTGAADSSFEIAGRITITAISLDVIQLQVTYTDETSTSRTAIFFPMGLTVAGLSVTGASTYPVMGSIRVKASTTITVATVLTTGTGSITYNAGATVVKLR